MSRRKDPGLTSFTNVSADPFYGSNVRPRFCDRFQPVMRVGEQVDGFVDTTPYQVVDKMTRSGGNIDVPRPAWGNCFDIRKRDEENA